MNKDMDNPAQNQNPVIPPIPDENGGFPASGGFGGPPPTAPVVGTTAPTGGTKSRSTGKIVATIFGLLLLVGGIGAGIILVNQQQTLKEKAAGGISCGAGVCNDGFSFGQDCNAPQASCDQRKYEACTSPGVHGGIKSGGDPITCGAGTGGTGGTGATLSAGQQCAAGSNILGNCPAGYACSQYTYSGCPAGQVKCYDQGGNATTCQVLGSSSAADKCSQLLPTTSIRGARCESVTTGGGAPSGNACSGSCCNADTAGGFHVRSCSCGGSLSNGRCDKTNGTCHDAGGSACIPSNFCGSMQLDVVNANDQESGIAIARNGQSVCTGGQLPVVQPGGGGGIVSTSNKACGDTCSSDSDCRNPSANGSNVKCINGTCQNTSCVGKTIPGANCDCSSLNACGQGCSATVGLCQTGSTCRYIVGPSCTADPNPAVPSTTFCVPNPVPAGWTEPKCVARDQGNAYVLNASGQNPTLAEIQQACAPTVTAQCSNVGSYDTNWNPLTVAELSALKPGDKVRFTVTGTTSAGAFDQARFTINGAQQTPVTGKRPNSADFFEEYTIPAGVTNFTVTAQIHLPSNDTWY